MSEKLGRAAYLTIGTSDMEKSIALYTKLGYTVENSGQAPAVWSEISDGSLHIILVEGKDEYLGLTYIADHLKNVPAQLEKAGLKPVLTIGTEDEPQQIIAQLRNGMLVSVNQAQADGDYNYKSKSLMDIDFENPSPEDFPNANCGIFGELALNITDMDREVQFWEAMGFKLGDRFEQPYPWAIVTDGMFVIGLHQTDDFDKPALTYFGLDMAEKLKKLVEAGIEFSKNDNEKSGTIDTPEGQRFFLFSLDS